MDDLCLSIRMFRELNDDSRTSVEKLIENFSDFLETAEETVIRQLSEILMDELNKGLNKDQIRTLIRNSGDAIGAAPIARKDHLIYGILDLIQQYIQPIQSGKIDNEVINLCIRVTKDSPYSYLRCKAFEVLAVMSSKPGVGQAPIHFVNALLMGETWAPEIQEKVRGQWRVMRTRAVEFECYLTEVSSKVNKIVPSTPSAIQVNYLLKCGMLNSSS
jgi:hypothetical protein